MLTLGARVRVIAPPTLIPSNMDRLGVEVFHDMRAGLADCDIVMMLRLQRERMEGSFVPSVHEYFHFYGLDAEKLNFQPLRRERRRIQHHERSIFAGGTVMDQARYHLLARAGRAGDQDAAIGRRHLFDRLLQLDHDVRAAD